VTRHQLANTYLLTTSAVLRKFKKKDSTIIINHKIKSSATHNYCHPAALSTCASSELIPGLLIPEHPRFPDFFIPVLLGMERCRFLLR